TAPSELAGCSEDPPGPIQRAGGDAARLNLAAGGGQDVARAGQAGERIEENDHVPARFDLAGGPVQDGLGYPPLLAGLAVERGTDDLGVGPADPGAHVGDLLGALVDEQDRHPALGM